MNPPASDRPALSRRAMLRGAMLLGVGAAGATVPLLTTPHASAQGAPPTIHDRAAWGARAPRETIPIINHPPNKIVVHHTATANQSDTSLTRAFALSRGIQNWHMDNNGWPDAGQQFTISRGGHILEARHQSLPTLQAGSSFPQGIHTPTQNAQSIGIENEGTYETVDPPAALYDSLVAMCAYLCQQYGIAPTEIFGHREFSSTDCPGEVLFGMLPQLRSDVTEAISGNAGGGDFEDVVAATSAQFRPGTGWRVGSPAAPAGDAGSAAGGSYGEAYYFADPVLESDASWYRLEIPVAGTYLVDAWWPANPGHNNHTPYVIMSSNGAQTVHVDQRTSGGRWANLGSFPLDAGSYDVVGVSRWTTGAGYVIADAIRVRS